MWLAYVVLILAWNPTPLSAHTRWVDPPPRNTSSGLKTGPCGNVPPTNRPTVYPSGEDVYVTWEETVDHPGWYRIAFSPGGDEDFDTHILADNLPDTPGLGTYTLMLTLPSVECTGCTLQLIQVMTDKPKEDGEYQKYYSCADIELQRDSIPIATEPPGATATPEMDTTATPAGAESPTPSLELTPTPSGSGSPSPDDETSPTFADSGTESDSQGSPAEDDTSDPTQDSDPPEAAPSTQPPGHDHGETPPEGEPEGGRCHSGEGSPISSLMWMILTLGWIRRNHPHVRNKPSISTVGADERPSPG